MYFTECIIISACPALYAMCLYSVHTHGFHRPEKLQISLDFFFPQLGGNPVYSVPTNFSQTEPTEICVGSISIANPNLIAKRFRPLHKSRYSSSLTCLSNLNDMMMLIDHGFI